MSPGQPAARPTAKVHACRPAATRGPRPCRLSESERIISRTLAGAIVAGLLVGVYAGWCCCPPGVLSVHSPVAMATSRMAAAALLNPLRRAQRVVDRRWEYDSPPESIPLPP
jgi:hypothetical protein